MKVYPKMIEIFIHKFEKKKKPDVRAQTENKLFWGYVRAKTQTKAIVGNLIQENGELTTSDQETANLLNDYFASVFEIEGDDPIPAFDDRQYDQPLTSINVTNEKIVKVINELKANKSQGPDDFHPKLIKETVNKIKEPLCKIFDKSLQEGVLPDDWKKANVTPIFKSGDKKRAENYRPISLTSVPGKLLEKLIRNELVDHMTRNNLFSEAQHGFIKGRSCVMQLLEFLEEITEAVDNGDEVDIIYLDFCKAFDKVPHKRLLKKIEGYGIKGQILKWIEAFLSNRKQRVMINGSFSEWQPVTSGIPQGSVLGPILFIIYINDLPEVIKCFIKLYADDAKVYSVVNYQPQKVEVQYDVRKSEIWSIDWQMFFNIPKCKHMHMGREENNTSYVMTPNNKEVPITKVSSEKDLGVVIDNKLLFREHISGKVKTANKILGLIFRTFTYMDKDMFLDLYKTLVRPHLEYATPIWTPLYKKDSIMLENVQRRATRLVKALSGLTYQERLLELGLPSLEYRRLRADVIEVYKIINQIDKINIDKFFTFTQNAGNRGHSRKLYKKRSRLNVRANTFSNRVVDVWNSLTESVVMAPTLNTFKSRLNKYWHGHHLKFNPSCYIPGQPTGWRKPYRNGSTEVIDGLEGPLQR